MAIIEGKVGGNLAPALAGDGAQATARLNREGALVIVQGHGRYQEAVARGNVFLAANSATQALSVNTTAATGIILTNPPNSGRNLSVLEICVSIASLPAGQYSIILTAPTLVSVEPTHTTPLVVRNALIGSANTGVGKVDSAATIANNAIVRVMPGGGAATMAASTAYPPFIRDEVSGLITLAPGTYLALQALTTAVTCVSSIMWEEVAI